MPRIVRLGRPANDNVRGIGPTVTALAALIVATLAVAAIVWRAL